ncbi:MAG TPA: Na+/H+ antiporter subunit B [Anaerolineae bacterium]|nr:Na+/H+ antiporter subunit B [Anaerolineae bacterium]
MSNLVLRTATRLLLPLLMLFSIFLLLNGHNAPGGGFIGGLVAAAAFILHSLAFGADATQEAMRLRLDNIIGLGLLIILTSGLIPLALGYPFMRGVWLKQEIPVIGHFGTPFLFDIGVYFVVIGITLLIMFNLEIEQE